MNSKEKLRLAATGDLHCKKSSRDGIKDLLSAMAAEADILLLAGDLCDTGLPEEAQIIAQEIVRIKVPVVAVLGNHDFEAGKEVEIASILTDAGVNVLDGKCCEVYGIGFAGVKGFCGGFGDRALQSWGEPAIKTFVYEAVEESLKLESALAKLTTPERIAILHYAPIFDTVVGEPLEIVPFLGSSRLEEPLNRYSIRAAFHGHAHHGTVQGTTTQGVPVYNVCKALLERTFAGRPPFRILEIESHESNNEPAESSRV
jgi:Icc-related predicted phosphoesterase